MISKEQVTRLRAAVVVYEAHFKSGKMVDALLCELSDEEQADTHRLLLESVAPLLDAIDELTRERDEDRKNLGGFIAKVDVALGGTGTAAPERVIAKVHEVLRHKFEQHTRSWKREEEAWNEELAQWRKEKGRIDELTRERDAARRQRDDLANFNPDWDMLEAARDSLREHMALGQELKARAEKAETAAGAMREAAAPLIEWLEVSAPACARLNAPTALVGPSQIDGRDVGLTVVQAAALLDAFRATTDAGTALLARHAEEVEKLCGENEVLGTALANISEGSDMLRLTRLLEEMRERHAEEVADLERLLQQARGSLGAWSRDHENDKRNMQLVFIAERGRLEGQVLRCASVLTELLPVVTCACGPEYTERGRHASNSQCHMEADVRAALADVAGG